MHISIGRGAIGNNAYRLIAYSKGLCEYKYAIHIP